MIVPLIDTPEQARAAAEQDLQKMEIELRDTLAASRARKQAPQTMGAAQALPR
mgnify:CR=1 FL=1